MSQSGKSQAGTRRALIHAAENLFEEYPIEEVTLTDIATAAGFTKGAIYSNFTSKTDLLIGVLERHMELLYGEYEWLTGIDPAAEVGNVDEHTRANHGTNLGYLRVMAALWTASLDDQEVGDRVVACQTKSWDNVRETIEGMALGSGFKLPVDSRELSVGILCMGSAVLLRSKYDPSVDPGAIMTTMMAVVVHGIQKMAEDSTDDTGGQATNG